MDIFKRAPKPNDNPEQPNTGRRSFMWKVGAGMLVRSTHRFSPFFINTFQKKISFA